MEIPFLALDRPSWAALMERLRWALRTLGLKPRESQIESLAIGIHLAMGGSLRRFHTLEHLFALEAGDALELLAMLYHDVVYWTVDQAWPT